MTEDDQALPVWCAGEEWCPITATAMMIAKKWHPVIINRLDKNGALGFNELKEEVDGISSKVLSESLDDLETKKLVDRDVISEKPFRVKYSLTEKGKDLGPVIDEMARWGNENLMKAEKSDSVV